MIQDSNSDIPRLLDAFEKLNAKAGACGARVNGGIAVVAAQNLGEARERGRVERLHGQLRQHETQHAARGDHHGVLHVGAQRNRGPREQESRPGPHRHQIRLAARLRHGDVQGDEPAHRVAQQEARLARAPGGLRGISLAQRGTTSSKRGCGSFVNGGAVQARLLVRHEKSEVAREVAEQTHVRAVAVTKPVALVVHSVHADARRVEDARRVLVAARVLRKAVREEEHGHRLRHLPAAHVQVQSLRVANVLRRKVIATKYDRRRIY